MNTFSFALLHGKVIREPVVRTVGDGKKLCTFPLCLRNGRQSENKNENYDFFEVTAWQKTAELAADRIKKGDFVEVVGRFKHDRWKNKDDEPRSRVTVTADRIGFLSYLPEKEKSEDIRF
jgi:single-strand DNA-binding protein